MPNWNSRKGKYTPVKNEETKRKEDQARRQLSRGDSKPQIAGDLGLSRSRVNELTRDVRKS